MELTIEPHSPPAPPSPAARRLKLKRSGVQVCGCGRTISANKHTCLSCATRSATSETAAAIGPADHDHERMTDEGCPHDPPDAPSTVAASGDLGRVVEPIST